ncbi:hypothetical protein HYX14_02105 [Candidatus Woesearchaeota archaeon]|nr:hypothetical protein [Candidatus Woesearchaeota archaeon]
MPTTSEERVRKIVRQVTSALQEGAPFRWTPELYEQEYQQRFRGKKHHQHTPEDYMALTDGIRKQGTLEERQELVRGVLAGIVNLAAEPEFHQLLLGSWYGMMGRQVKEMGKVLMSESYAPAQRLEVILRQAVQDDLPFFSWCTEQATTSLQQVLGVEKSLKEVLSLAERTYTRRLEKGRSLESKEAKLFVAAEKFLVTLARTRYYFPRCQYEAEQARPDSEH